MDARDGEDDRDSEGDIVRWPYSSKREDLMLGLGVLLVVVVVGVLTYAFDRASCSNYGLVTGKDTEYRLLGGCFVETDRGWFLKDQVYDQEANR